MSDCIVRSRIDPEIKAKASVIFNKMGLTLSDAVRIFLYKSVSGKGIPFDVSIPNAETVKAMKEIETHSKKLKGVTRAQLKKEWENLRA